MHKQSAITVHLLVFVIINHHQHSQFSPFEPINWVLNRISTIRFFWRFLSVVNDVSFCYSTTEANQGRMDSRRAPAF